MSDAESTPFVQRDLQLQSSPALARSPISMLEACRRIGHLHDLWEEDPLKLYDVFHAAGDPSAVRQAFQPFVPVVDLKVMQEKEEALIAYYNQVAPITWVRRVSFLAWMLLTPMYGLLYHRLFYVEPACDEKCRALSQQCMWIGMLHQPERMRTCFLQFQSIHQARSNLDSFMSGTGGWVLYAAILFAVLLFDAVCRQSLNYIERILKWYGCVNVVLGIRIMRQSACWVFSDQLRNKTQCHNAEWSHLANLVLVATFTKFTFAACIKREISYLLFGKVSLLFHMAILRVFVGRLSKLSWIVRNTLLGRASAIAMRCDADGPTVREQLGTDVLCDRLTRKDHIWVNLQSLLVLASGLHVPSPSSCRVRYICVRNACTQQSDLEQDVFVDVTVDLFREEVIVHGEDAPKWKKNHYPLPWHVALPEVSTEKILESLVNYPTEGMFSDTENLMTECRRHYDDRCVGQFSTFRKSMRGLQTFD